MQRSRAWAGLLNRLRGADGDFQQVKLFGYVKAVLPRCTAALSTWELPLGVSDQPSGHDRFHEIVPSTDLFLSIGTPSTIELLLTLRFFHPVEHDKRRKAPLS